MSQILALSGLCLQLIFVAIWSGGLLYFSVVVAPLAFRELGSRHLAGDFTSACLRRFQTWEASCALLSLCGSGLLYVAPITSPLIWGDVAIALAMFLIFVVYAGVLMPKLDTLRLELRNSGVLGHQPDPAKMQLFFALHRWYSGFVTVNIVLSFALFVLLAALASQCGVQESPAAVDTMLFGGPLNQWF